ncbi:hypothetical protein BSLG_000864 [Batrachochytrium salamandrivorans]|nr:hypothetical protein BSLG_000864 [Batrachochytrium salamandrivorans]
MITGTGTGISLQAQFQHAIGLYNKLDNSDLSCSDISFQTMAKETADLLLDCKHKVESLSMFSTNEILEDINTADLRFLLVNAYLGEVVLQILSQDRGVELTKAEGHFRNYLTQLEQYEILSKSDKQFLLSELGQITLTADLRRNEKTQRFKMEKELKGRLQMLTEQLRLKGAANSASGDNAGDLDGDDVEREIVMATVQLMVLKSIASLRMIKDEREMLEFAKKRREAQQTMMASGSVDTENRVEMAASRRRLADYTGPLMDTKGKPLRPFVVRSQRETVKEGVFRPGHNLPTMTIDEYLEREMERGNFLSGGTKRPEKYVAPDNDNDAIETEMYKARAFDEFKDDNPRGWGESP